MENIPFTKEMKKTHTILAPNMLPIHFDLMADVFHLYGYNFEVLHNEGKTVVEAGLRHVHNDTCYPALLVIGQLIDALDSGKYDIDKVALLITQTGGGCRASNYIHLLRKALVKAGYEHVPVISLSTTGMEKSEGFNLTFPFLRKLLTVVAYGDILMLLKNQVKPYEVAEGATDSMVQSWREKIKAQLDLGKGMSVSQIQRNFYEIVKDFGDIEIKKTHKTKVGVVGEIYVKYASLGNNALEDFLFAQNCEYMVPGLMGFILYSVENMIQDIKLYGGSKIKQGTITLVLKYLEKIENAMIKAVSTNSKFCAPSSFKHLKTLTKDVVGMGNKMGEGWLLPAEMVELCTQGYENIVCAQPFGCLPNHIVGKGTLKKIKELYPIANITAIDYDPGAAKVNQENRIKLMLAMAKDREEIRIQEKAKRKKSVMKTAAAAAVLR